MKMKNITIVVLSFAFVGCTFVGNSPEERKHRETFQDPDPTSQIIEVGNPNPSDANPTNLVEFRLKTDSEKSEPLSALADKIQNRDGTKFLGQYLGMIAELNVGAIWPSTNITKSVWMYSATSGELLRVISYDEFRQVYVLKIRPEYP